MAWYKPSTWGSKSHEGGGFGLGAFFPTVSDPFRASTYQAFAFEGYKRNSTAFMCATLIGRSIANLPIKVFTTAPDGEKIIVENHPVSKLVGPGSKPSPGMSWLDLMQTIWAYRHIDGNEYWFSLGDLNMPGELRALRPDRMKPVKGDKSNPIRAWEYRVNGTTQTIPVEQILHTMSFDPLSDSFGFPVFEPCLAEIDEDNNAGAWNNALLKNGGRLSLIFSTPDDAGPPSSEQTKMIEQWYQANITGMADKGKPVISPGLKIQEVGKSPKDVDWLKGRVQAKVAIANSCGVPPELIGIQDQKTFANYETALRAFHEHTVLPYADDMYEALTQFLGNRWQGGVAGRVSGVTIAVDRENVIALQENRDAKHKRIRDDVGGPILTANEGRAELGNEDVEGGDVILVAANKIPLDEVVDGDQDGDVLPDNLPIPPEEDEDEE